MDNIAIDRMNNPLHQLIALSMNLGSDNTLVQGSGGNTSTKTKDGSLMYIKASGIALKDLNNEQGWRCLDVTEVLNILDDPELSLLGVQEREVKIIQKLLHCCVDDLDTNLRPSVESHFHAMLNTVAIHLHPLAVAAFVCAKNGKAELFKLFSHKKEAILWVPYANPGYSVAKRMRQEVEIYQSKHTSKPSVIFLQKHGLVISAETVSEAINLVYEVVGICKESIAQDSTQRFETPEEKMIQDAVKIIYKCMQEFDCGKVTVRHFLDEEIIRFISLDDAEALAALPAVIPEELAYSNGPAIWLEVCDMQSVTNAINRKLKEGKRVPTCFVVKNLGLFVSSTERAIPMIKEVISASLFIRRCSRNFGGVDPLTKTEREFIEEWESESFRIKLAQGV